MTATATARHRAIRTARPSALDRLRSFFQEWKTDLERTTVVDFRPVVTAVEALADRWARRQGAEVERTLRTAELAAADAAWGAAIKAWAGRRVTA